MTVYEKALNSALRCITIARERYAYTYADQFDYDWAMEEFNRAACILERMRDVVKEKTS